MSSKRVRSFKKEVKILSGVFDSGTSLITVTTASNHKLATGDIVSILTSKSTTQVDATVTVTGVTTFTFPSTYDLYLGVDAIVVVKFFRSLDSTGLVSILTTGNNTALGPVVGSTITGTGTAVYDIQGSLDGINFKTLTTITHTANSTMLYTVSGNIPFIGINITTAVTDTATKLEIRMSS